MVGANLAPPFSSKESWGPPMQWRVKRNIRILRETRWIDDSYYYYFYMLKHSFQRHICWPNLIFDGPTIKQKLKFFVLVRHVKVAIRNNKWHAKRAIRNNKWHAKLAIRNNKSHAKLTIVWIAYFACHLLFRKTTFTCLTIARNSSFCLIEQPIPHYSLTPAPLGSGWTNWLLRIFRL